MNFNKPLFWHQGLFLQPQHFQYQSLYTQQTEYQLLGLNNAFPWGISNMQLEPQALSRGQIDFNYLTLLFEDGALVSFPDNAQIAPRSFEAIWTDRTKPLSAYVAIAKTSESLPNVTQVPSYDNSQSISSRYVSLVEGENVKDLHQGGQAVAIKTMKYVAKIVFEQELDNYSDCLVLPLTCIEEQEGEVVYSKDFIPPSLSIRASFVLMDILKEVRDELIGRSKQLENYKSTSTSRTAEFNPVSERYRSALRVIARYAPMFNNYIEQPSVTPFEVFGHLRALIGELSTFSIRYSILGESSDGKVAAVKYNHRDLFGCFESSKQLIINLLDELTVSPELLVKFEKQQDGSFSAKLPSEFFVRQHAMYLMLETNVPSSEFMMSFRSFAKLGAKSEVDQFVQRAIPGIEFEHLDEQPSGLEHRPKITYFTIDRTSSKWKTVEEQGLFSLHWDDAPEDLSIEMVLVRG